MNALDKTPTSLLDFARFLDSAYRVRAEKTKENPSQGNALWFREFALSLYRLLQANGLCLSVEVTDDNDEENMDFDKREWGMDVLGRIGIGFIDEERDEAEFDLALFADGCRIWNFDTMDSAPRQSDLIPWDQIVNRLLAFLFEHALDPAPSTGEEPDADFPTSDGTIYID